MSRKGPEGLEIYTEDEVSLVFQWMNGERIGCSPLEAVLDTGDIERFSGPHKALTRPQLNWLESQVEYLECNNAY